MGFRGHSYKLGTLGRRLTTRPGVGGVTITAHLACSQCRKIGDVVCRQIMPPDQIDKKFMQHGWRIDPNICPTCAATKPKDKPMTAKPTPAAMKAQANMFQLLSQHFDPDAGHFASGWTDERIAKETGLALDMVREFRRAGFGEIKEPAEMQSLRSDINSIEQLAKEQYSEMTSQVAALRGRLARVAETFGASRS